MKESGQRKLAENFIITMTNKCQKIDKTISFLEIRVNI